MQIKQLNSRTFEVHFAAQNSSVFYYAGLVDPKNLADHPESIHICLVRFPKLKPVEDKTYLRKRSRSHLTKQMFAYLDRKHIEFTGKPFPRSLVSIFDDPTNGTVSQRIEFLEGFAKKHSQNFEKIFNSRWMSPFGSDVGVVDAQ
jgi:hypothetical protein